MGGDGIVNEVSIRFIHAYFPSSWYPGVFSLL